MRLLFLPKAQQDFLWVRQYYGKIFPEGANQALVKFDMMESLLLANPYLGKKKQGEVRALKIPKTPFSYFYRVRETHIEVLRVWDERRDD